MPAQRVSACYIRDLGASTGIRDVPAFASGALVHPFASGAFVPALPASSSEIVSGAPVPAFAGLIFLCCICFVSVGRFVRYY